MRFYDELLYSILMFNKSSIKERWDNFRTFIDYLDLDRDRIHLILPLLVKYCFLKYEKILLKKNIQL